MISPFRMVVAALAASAWANVVHAAQATVTINATVVEIHCTAEQRLRIRACAPAVATITREAAKTLVPRREGNDAAALPRYELMRDPTRSVLVKTLLY